MAWTKKRKRGVEEVWTADTPIGQEGGVSNRHPVDELADVRDQIRELAARERKLVDVLKQPDADRRGEEFEATVTVSQRRRIDTALAARVLPKPLFEQIVSTTAFTRLSVRYRKKSAT